MQESWHRFRETSLAHHWAEADAAATENNPNAEAYHLRVLLREYAFADIELAMKLRDAEAKLTPREVLPPPRISPP